MLPNLLCRMQFAISPEEAVVPASFVHYEHADTSEMPHRDGTVQSQEVAPLFVGKTQHIRLSPFHKHHVSILLQQDIVSSVYAKHPSLQHSNQPTKTHHPSSHPSSSMTLVLHIITPTELAELRLPPPPQETPLTPSRSTSSSRSPPNQRLCTRAKHTASCSKAPTTDASTSPAYAGAGDTPGLTSPPTP
jgi:hypothetical protein